MFAWLSNLFRKAPPPDLYRPKERQVYRYWDGAHIVPADPMTLFRRVMANTGDLTVDMKVANSPSKDNDRAYGSLAAKVREIFALKPFADGGLSDPEAVDLLDHFLEYCDGVKKNSSFWPTFSTAFPGPAPASSGAAAPPTSAPWDSGSTAAAPSTAAPPPSPSGPASPSAG